ncbi:MAG: KOW domain-containing RNA-binding protein [Lachnospiraceae bacterium]|nr:KOW domain-containing RNA-binding protein [Lachnospiraceae bacterium]
MYEGLYAVSTAGHDRNKLYIILKEENDMVFLSDGKLRPVDRPKKKKLKHVRLIKKITFNEEIEKKLSGGNDLCPEVTNEEIKRAIGMYREDNECQKPM